jgi:hypothetical protein
MAVMLQATSAESRPAPVAEHVLFAVLVAGSGLGAYALGPVPVQWLVQAMAPLVLLFLVLRGGLHRMPGTATLLVLCAWLSAVSLIRVAELQYFRGAMPPLATTPYAVYILLRFAEIIAFLAIALSTYWLCCNGGREGVLRTITRTGTVLALVALYIYIAQIYGLPEPRRTRLGTGGVEGQVIEFTYAFHRALGTFREPSHLAEWLVVPLFAAAARSGRWINIHSGIMGVVLLLTGSLTGIMGATGGIIAASLLLGPLRFNTWRSIAAIGLFGYVLLWLFGLLVSSYDSADINLIALLSDRIAPILSGGMIESNRAVVYEFMATHAFPLLGYGPGNANIVLTAAIDWPAMSTFLSLYLGTLYSGGPIALALLILFLGQPLAATLLRRGLIERPGFFPLTAGYFAWLIMFSVHAEYLTFMFAVVYALLVHDLQRAPLRAAVALWSRDLRTTTTAPLAAASAPRD